ncbi:MULTISPECIES: AMP-binding protein [Gordonia]|uniref:AMP-binding protein n=1 Tax=Gordonia TaxID=2053 RepID=UPI001EEF8E2C|nr:MULTISPECIES: AMP-binding protein [unclassified Gordonia (in: high G+C Gram-positive bacteria)]MCT1352543.1 AMP-binding protein [Gordonia sp. p3-SID1431]
MSQTSASCSPLSGAHDTHGSLPAVHTGDAVIDFERFYESVEWMAEQLVSCGVRAGSRVGLVIRTGWEFVLAWHSLLEVDAVTVPIVLGPSCEPAHSCEIGFVLAHVDQCIEVEDLVEAAVPRKHCRQMYRVGDEFVLAALRTADMLRNEGGLVVDLGDGSQDATGQLIAEAERMVADVGLRRGEYVSFEGDLGTRDTMVRILACASAGACVAVDAPYGEPHWGAPTTR